MAFLRRPAVRATLIALLVVYLAGASITVVLAQPTLLGALLALPVGAAALGGALWLLASREVSARNAWLLLLTLSSALAMHALEPFTGSPFYFYAIFIAPHRVGPRLGVTMALLPIPGLPLVSYLAGLDMGAAIGMTTGLVYFVVFSILAWHLAVTKRQTAEVAEARASEAVLSERSRLAREVHDILAHSQSAQIVHLESARLLLKSGADPAAALDRVERAVHLARAGLEETRRALDTLRGKDLHLPERLERLAAEFRATTGAPCTLSLDPAPGSLTAEAKLAVARTAQEALTNVRKHAPGAAVTLALHHRDRWCELHVRDTGTTTPSRTTHPAPFTPSTRGPRTPPAAPSPEPVPPGALAPGPLLPGSLSQGPLPEWALPERVLSGEPLTEGALTEGALTEEALPEEALPEGPPPEGVTTGERGMASDGGATGRGWATGGRWAVDVPSSPGGYGLIGMRERAELIGGSLVAGPAGEGFAVTLRVPA
ncbi:histidine kinase [Nonomuraea sp. NPDC023979]|uniref:histidine kinase n=1 Tax=Nonomuraea sp. NPDC023979 TaxID=3154796 RepID=UPI0033F1894A